ncbi:hypothetical protein ACFL6B_00090 [Thermodesulfobacteriota bacterium]
MIKKVFQRIARCNVIQNHRHGKYYRRWLKLGKPIPPPHTVKQMIVKEYAKKFKTRIFVETGTYLGDMVLEMIDNFYKIYSIELSPDLYEQAKKKFSGYKHVSILKGDSSYVLSEILKDIKEPCLFWLDAHYSKGITAMGSNETPVIEELKYILHHPVDDHVILIDDARCFTEKRSYPTLEKLKQLIWSRCPHYAFEVKDDIIRSHKRENPVSSDTTVQVESVPQ